MGAVGGPELGNAEAGYAGRGELGLGVKNLDLLLECHTGECVIDAVLDIGIQVEIKGNV